MPELQPNGNYEAYLAQLFNPMAGGAQFNPGVLGTIGSSGIGSGFGGAGVGTIPGMTPNINPWTMQNPTTPWSQQTQNPFQQNPFQSLQAIQVAQQVAAKQALHAIQCAQALQTLQHQVQGALTQQTLGPQAQFGHAMSNPYGQFGQSLTQPYGFGSQYQQYPQTQGVQQQALQQQMLQQQVLQQLAQYLASQQSPYRYGLAA